MAGPTKFGVGLSIPEVAGRARGSPDPVTAALVARMSAAPTAPRTALIDATVRSLKASGVWAKLDLLYVMAAHDAQAARLNWVVAAYDLAAVNSPAFTVDRGYAGDGTTSYLSTGWLPSTGVRFQLDSGSLGCWLNAGGDAAGSVAAMGCTGASDGCVLAPRGPTGPIRGRINTATSADSNGVSATRMGHSALSRTSASLVTAYRNGVADGTVAGASVSRPALPLYLCGNNFTGSFSNGIDNRFAAAWAGAGLSGGEVAALHAALAAYLTAMGGA